MADVSDTRLLFSWLPTILPKCVKIIFSGDSEAKSHDALSSLAGGNEAKIDKWDIADVNKFIQEKLGLRGRTITPEQTSYVDKSIGGEGWWWWWWWGGAVRSEATSWECEWFYGRNEAS